jgi:hypothetical protein
VPTKCFEAIHLTTQTSSAQNILARIFASMYKKQTDSTLMFSGEIWCVDAIWPSANYLSVYSIVFVDRVAFSRNRLPLAHFRGANPVCS